MERWRANDDPIDVPCIGGNTFNLISWDLHSKLFSGAFLGKFYFFPPWLVNWLVFRFFGLSYLHSVGLLSIKEREVLFSIGFLPGETCGDMQLGSTCPTSKKAVC